MNQQFNLKTEIKQDQMHFFLFFYFLNILSFKYLQSFHFTK